MCLVSPPHLAGNATESWTEAAVVTLAEARDSTWLAGSPEGRNAWKPILASAQVHIAIFDAGALKMLQP